jgi:hypothetical protein
MSGEVSDEVRRLTRTVVRIQAGVLGLVCAVLGGLSIFLMTAWLLIKGGAVVGPHLSLLGQYFYGYSVSWSGSLIGFAYGALVGGVTGWLVGVVYNSVAGLRR